METGLRAGTAEGSSADRARLALVLNEKAGALLGGTVTVETLHAHIRDTGFDLVDIPPGPLPDRLARAAASGADRVAVAGGDGTVACAAAALSDSGTALGILPCGTMNLLARDLGLPLGDLAAALAVVFDGQRRTIDVGMLGETPFLCAAMLGTPARLARYRESGRAHGQGILSWLRFGRAAWRAMRREKPLRVTAVIDGRTVKLRTRSLTVVVNALDDEHGRLFARSQLDGGRFAIYVVRGRLLRLLPGLLRGHVAHNRRVAVLRGREIELRSGAGALRVLLDGEEHLLAPPLCFRLRPRALTVMAPP